MNPVLTTITKTALTTSILLLTLFGFGVIALIVAHYADMGLVKPRPDLFRMHHLLPY